MSCDRLQSNSAQISSNDSSKSCGSRNAVDILAMCVALFSNVSPTLVSDETHHVRMTLARSCGRRYGVIQAVAWLELSHQTSSRESFFLYGCFFSIYTGSILSKAGWY